MKLRLLCACLICALALTLCCACGETVRGDLSERFSSEQTVDYEGVKYRVKNRMATMVFLIVDDDAAPQEQIWMMGILSVDDSAKKIRPLFIDPRTLTKENATIFDVFSEGESLEARCVQLVEELNLLLPHPILGDYLALKIEGLDVLDGGVENASPDTLKQRLKTIKRDLEASGTNDLMDVLDRLSAYIETNMKTGAVVRIGDKTEYYDVLPSQNIAGEQLSEDGKTVIRLHADTLLPLYIDAFYEEKIW